MDDTSSPQVMLVPEEAVLRRLADQRKAIAAEVRALRCTKRNVGSTFICVDGLCPKHAIADMIEGNDG